MTTPTTGSHHGKTWSILISHNPLVVVLRLIALSFAIRLWPRRFLTDDALKTDSALTMFLGGITLLGVSIAAVSEESNLLPTFFNKWYGQIAIETGYFSIFVLVCIGYFYLIQCLLSDYIKLDLTANEFMSSALLLHGSYFVIISILTLMTVETGLNFVASVKLGEHRTISLAKEALSLQTMILILYSIRRNKSSSVWSAFGQVIMLSGWITLFLICFIGICALGFLVWTRIV